MKPKIVLLLGSGPNVLECRDWPKPDNIIIVAINNAWRIRRDWDYLIYPEDFPADRKPHPEDILQKTIHSAHSFVPSNNVFGGIVYCGGTMAFTAGYHILHALKPDILAYFGCDMHYPKNGQKTHFYGTGTADPLREDITLQNLSAKSIRLLVKAVQSKTLVVNLSKEKTSHLRFPLVRFKELIEFRNMDVDNHLRSIRRFIKNSSVEAAMKAENNLGYFLPSGLYWTEQDKMDWGKIREIDDLWVASIRGINTKKFAELIPHTGGKHF